jgi:glycosyltransferase involved in cell wall biosynthesis
MVSRVVVISDQAIARGGAEAVAIASARLFSDAGIPVTFFSGDAGVAPELEGSSVEFLAAGGTHVLQAGKLAAFRDGLYTPASRRVLETWIAENDGPGVIYHLHSFLKILSPSIFAALAKVQDRLVIHAHDFFMVCPNGAFMIYPREETCGLVPMQPACLTTNCDKRNYAEKLWRVGRQTVRARYFDVAKSPARYLMVHRGMAPLLRRGGVREDALHVVRNPLAPPDRPRVIAEENSLVCFIGRLDPEKGALDAAQAARAAGMRLRIIGDGVQRAQIEAEYPEVEILGWCAPAQVSEHLAAARLLVVPSRWRETFGMVVVEALRLGIPVVISDKALIAEDLAASGAGLAIDTQDPDLFAAQLRLLRDSGETVRAMSEKAMQTAAALTMTPEQWRDELLRQYGSMLSRSAATTR